MPRRLTHPLPCTLSSVAPGKWETTERWEDERIGKQERRRGCLGLLRFTPSLFYDSHCQLDPRHHPFSSLPLSATVTMSPVAALGFDTKMGE